MAKRSNEYQLEGERLQKKLLNNEGEEVIKEGVDWSNASLGKLENFVKNDTLLSGLNKKGIKTLMPIQYKTFDHIYSGSDIIARDRTGSGKTLAFTLPVLQMFLDKKYFEDLPGKTKFIIILPTRELAIQVSNEIDSVTSGNRQLLRTVTIYGGTSIQGQIDQLSKGCDIVVGTPGRLKDFINRKQIRLENVKVLCLDEADEMLNQGFKEDIQEIFQSVMKCVNTKPQFMMFSATIPQWIHEMSNQYQSKDRKFIDLIGNSSNQSTTSKTVQHFRVDCQGYSKQQAVRDLVEHFCKNGFEMGNQGRVLIFTQTKRDANKLGAICNTGMRNGVLHGDICQYQRQRVFRAFKRGEIRCVIATNVAARGLDFPSIALVIQFEPPKNTESYVHRSGRTGRIGNKGVCITLYNRHQRRLFHRIEHQARITIDDFQPTQGKKSGRKDWTTEISETERKRAMERGNDLELFVGGLPKECSEYEIRQHFESMCIRVVKFHLLRTNQGQSKSVGFLHCVNDEEKNKALELNKSRYRDRTIYISLPRPK